MNNGQIDHPRHSRQRHLMIDALNLARGGGVVVMWRLAFAFASKGYRVTVLTARDLPGANSAGSGVEIIVQPSARGGLRAMLYRLFRLTARAKYIGADAVLGFNYHAKVTLPQVTYHINIIPFLEFDARRKAVGYLRAITQRLAARSALRRSTANIFESDYVRTLAARSGITIRNPTVAYIGAEEQDHLSVCTNYRLSGPFVTVTSGAPHKRNDLTLTFFRRILAKEPNAKLVIVGDVGAIRAGLSAEDRKFIDASDQVSFKGYLARDQLYELLAQARALIVFSELESFFMVAIEAMSVGCPVIAADGTSIRESVGSAALVVPAGDVDAAVSAAGLLTTPEVFARQEAVGRKWASTFEADKCANSFVAAFENAIWPTSETVEGKRRP
ncbi:glycosyltransferase [Sulfitobacter sp. M39]|uniref:glycosyltransferase family 4 protein n=1 Tax=Sulfitobacter sp. M39 TaxID=2675334 RepID=UPI001F314E84|nr:glycosyltransferase family 4 protein [Sulfitobacter sp. M39]MCF7749058.1 glycosyltransferase [Sulfitobacter sp. M39]